MLERLPDFFAEDLLLFLAEDFFAEDFFADDFLAADFLAEVFFAEVFGGGGTFAPFLRASERPIAIACFGLVTFLPLLPDLSLPRFISCISVSTDFEAAGLYFRPLLFFAVAMRFSSSHWEALKLVEVARGEKDPWTYLVHPSRVIAERESIQAREQLLRKSRQHRA